MTAIGWLATSGVLLAGNILLVGLIRRARMSNAWGFLAAASILLDRIAMGYLGSLLGVWGVWFEWEVTAL